MDRGGGAVAFEASDVAAVARLAVDVDADMADFGGRSEGAVDDVAVVDHAEADAFADEVVGEVLGGDGGIEQVLGHRAGAGVLLHEHGDGERVAEFVDEVDFLPSAHRGHDGGASHAAQVGAGDGHADGDDASVGFDQRTDGVVELHDRRVDGVFGDLGQFLHGQRFAGEVEHAELYQASREFHGDDVEFCGVESEPDGAAVLAPLEIAGLLDGAGFYELGGDLGDGGGGEVEGFGDLRARADAVLVQVLHDPRTVGFGH